MPCGISAPLVVIPSRMCPLGGLDTRHQARALLPFQRLQRFFPTFRENLRSCPSWDLAFQGFLPRQILHPLPDGSPLAVSTASGVYALSGLAGCIAAFPLKLLARVLTGSVVTFLSWN